MWPGRSSCFDFLESLMIKKTILCAVILATAPIFAGCVKDSRAVVLDEKQDALMRQQLAEQLEPSWPIFLRPNPKPIYTGPAKVRIESAKITAPKTVKTLYGDATYYCMVAKFEGTNFLGRP